MSSRISLSLVLLLAFSVVGGCGDDGGGSNWSAGGSGSAGSGAGSSTDYCASSPCQNGGTCSSSGGTFICGCASGYSGTTCTGCSSHDVCAFDEMCYGATCEGVIGREHRVTVVSASVGTLMPSGASWDTLGGAPDLFVEWGLKGGQTCTTSAVSDSFSATWNDSCDFIFPSGGTFEIWLYDEDLVGAEAAAGWEFEGTDWLVELATLQGKSRTLESDDIFLTFSVTPLY